MGISSRASPPDDLTNDWFKHPQLYSIWTGLTTTKAMSTRGWVTKYTCCICRQNRSSNEQAMLVCASCMKAWHSCTFSLSLGAQRPLAHWGVRDSVSYPSSHSERTYEDVES